MVMLQAYFGSLQSYRDVLQSTRGILQAYCGAVIRLWVPTFPLEIELFLYMIWNPMFSVLNILCRCIDCSSFLSQIFQSVIDNAQHMTFRMYNLQFFLFNCTILQTPGGYIQTVAKFVNGKKLLFY